MNEEYQRYLRSAAWNEKRIRRLQIDHCRCAICGSSDQQLNVHHLTYRNIMQEDVEQDLITLCRSCHAMLHRIRECSAQEYQDYRSAEQKYKEIRRREVARKIYDLAVVEIWQRDISAGGDCKIFDVGAGMIGKLERILIMIYPELTSDLKGAGRYVMMKDFLRLARAMKICEMYRSGSSLNQVADAMGMKASNVQKVLKRHGFNQSARIK